MMNPHISQNQGNVGRPPIRTQETQTTLIFHHYGDHYILVRAELPNTKHGRAFQTEAVSHIINVGRQASQVKPEVVEIAGK